MYQSGGKQYYKILSSVGFLTIVASDQLLKMLLANHFGPADFGVYSIGLSLMFFFTTLILFSSEQVILRYVSKNRDNHSLHSSFFLFSLFLIVFGWLICWVSVKTVINFSTLFELSKDQVELIHKFIVMTLPFAVLRLIWSYNRALGENKKYFFNKFIIYELSVIMLYCATILADFSLAKMIYIQLFLISILALFILLKDIAFKRITIIAEILKKVGFKFFKISGYLTFSFLIAELRKRLDIFILAASLSKETLGIYSFCILLSRFPILIQTSFNQFLLPTIMLAKKTDSTELIKDRYSFIQEINTLLSLPLLLYVMLDPVTILSFFGKSYSGNNAQILLAVFSAINLFVIFAGPWGQILIAEGMVKLTFILSSLAFIISVTGFIVLIPQIGIYGAMLTVGLTLIIINLLGALYVASKYKIYPLTAKGKNYLLCYLFVCVTVLGVANFLLGFGLIMFFTAIFVSYFIGISMFYFICQGNDYRAFVSFKALLPVIGISDKKNNNNV
jgi:O-antigen/teichoic acid export membrane protein